MFWAFLFFKVTEMRIEFEIKKSKISLDQSQNLGTRQKV
jgi:hypothetical protein